MYVTEEEASERSRESMESARSETRKRRTACAWTGSEGAFEGEQDRIHGGVVTQGMEGDGVDSLWRAMSVIEGGQGTSAEVKEVRARVVTAVEERLQAEEMQEPLPQGETGWKEYVRKLVQGRRMGGPPEVEAWAVKNGYRVKVYRETKDGVGYRKIQEYGGEKGVLVSGQEGPILGLRPDDGGWVGIAYVDAGGGSICLVGEVGCLVFEVGRQVHEPQHFDGVADCIVLGCGLFPSVRRVGGGVHVADDDCGGEHGHLAVCLSQGLEEGFRGVAEVDVGVDDVELPSVPDDLVGA